MENSDSYEVAVLGAGYAGLMAALRLRRSGLRLRIALVGASDRFLERVRLQESIVADVPPRIPSLGAFLSGAGIEFIRGSVVSLDPDRRRARIAAESGEREIVFDQAIYALGSNIDVQSVPGAAEHAYRLEPGDGPRSAVALRSKLRESAGLPLRVVAVGGAETGIEVAGEIKAAWPRAEMTLLSRSRCGDFGGAAVERVVRAALARLDVRLIDGETIAEVRPREIVTDRGRAIACDICVWSGGLRSPPVACNAGLATDATDRIWVDARLRSISHPHVFAVGDAAHPVAPTGAPYRLSAFAALVSGAHAADVIVSQGTGRRLAPFSFSTFGQGIAIGRGGAGFFSYPDDRQSLFILEGAAARRVRDFFVWFVTQTLRIERRFPGFFFWPGRRRVSWHEANEALRRIRPPRQVRVPEKARAA
jgi:NADH dehydrogenase FAD-containing subunit